MSSYSQADKLSIKLGPHDSWFVRVMFYNGCHFACKCAEMYLSPDVELVITNPYSKKYAPLSGTMWQFELHRHKYLEFIEMCDLFVSSSSRTEDEAS